MYDIFQSFEKYEDPRTRNYFLLETPWILVFSLIFYWVFVFKIGPAFMKNRDPWQINKILVFYNILQITLNGFVFAYWCIPMLYDLNICCTISKQDNNFHFQAHYVYTVLKFLDLLDTVFFVLRKKYSQISVLHVHHHSGMLASSWISNKYFPGGHGLFVGYINTFIHSIMYFYYLKTTINPKNKSIWWKKYLTIMQILQHLFILFVFLVQMLNPNCNYPKFLSFLFWINCLLVTIQFCRFYSKNYLKQEIDKNL